ncbi:MAG: TonB-dependent receptor [Bacteroidales bacterium]|nr:TonB-dependent receptor [Bacteroidales bacterium]
MQVVYSQQTNTDANIFGHVVSDGRHLQFVDISVNGTAIGTATDETGHYRLLNLPEGPLTITASFMGYQNESRKVIMKRGRTLEVNFDLKSDALGLNQIVVTGDRSEKPRRRALVVVNTITPKLFASTNAITLSEGLNFSPGVRMETNCQNCGFNQVRMDGMEGAYSQILINGKSIFSGLAGVYGLEMIPSNMLEKVEVVRGGGSALYGSNAIAGTINLILKDPVANSYQFGINEGFVGVGLKDADKPAVDRTLNANTSVVSDDGRTGMSVYGFYRNRQPFDATDDGYSEVTKIKNTTFGTRVFHRFGIKSKITADFFNIREDRRGGDRFDYPEHEADISESLRHNITTGALTYDRYIGKNDLWSVYLSGQSVLRNSYYGANKSLKNYGKTAGFTYVAGSQYDAHFGGTELIVGAEYKRETLNDKKLGYPDYDKAVIEDGIIKEIPHTEDTQVADQTSSIGGVFAQYEFKVGKLDVSAGGRFDSYKISDKTSSSGDNSGNVFSPRVTLKYDIMKYLQARLSYSEGYRAPQVYDEDLHTATSGSRQVLHKNDPDLKQETSHSIMASLDYNKRINKNLGLEFLLEGFYTKLQDAFVSDYGEPDENGIVVYTRTNADDGATVKGINMELNIALGELCTFRSGFTVQSSKYGDAQNFNRKKFMRTPDDYGYFSMDINPTPKIGISLSGDYTGKMLIPYFGKKLADPDAGALIKSDPFFDAGAKIKYNVKFQGMRFQIYGGMKNIFNSYQDDFDNGIDRDPAFIYGPSLPRTIYIGIKIGNIH